MADSRIYDVLEEILADVGGGGGTPLVDRVDALEALVYAGSYDALGSGQSTVPRSLVNANVAQPTGVLRLAFFSSVKSETTTQARVSTITPAAAATPTLVRWGLYSVAANGDGTLVASTANDTTLFSVASTAYTRPWSAPYALTRGSRYAFGCLVVTGATAPNVAANTQQDSTEAARSPRLAGILSAQADLPAGFTDAGLTNSTSRIYAAILP